MNLTNLRRKNSPQLLDQEITFDHIKPKIAGNITSNIHVFPNGLSTLLPLQWDTIFSSVHHFARWGRLKRGLEHFKHVIKVCTNTGYTLSSLITLYMNNIFTARELDV